VSGHSFSTHKEMQNFYAYRQKSNIGDTVSRHCMISV